MKQSPLHIRPATESDVADILRLVKELAEFEKLRDQVLADESAYLKYGFGAQPKFHALMAEWENTGAVGFALYFFNFSTFVGKPGLYLEDIYVLPAYRGKGIGKELLRELAAIALENDCGRMEWSVLDWNEDAIGFYKSFGAVLLHDWKICRLTSDKFNNLLK